MNWSSIRDPGDVLARLGRGLDRIDDPGELARIGGDPGFVAPFEFVGPDPEDLPDELEKRLQDLLSLKRVPEDKLAELERAMRALRPAVPVENGQIASLPDQAAGLFANWETFRERVRPFLGSVARLDDTNGGGVDAAIGTGFVVGDRILATNRHVVESKQLEVGAIPSGRLVARFGEEGFPIAASEPVAVTDVLAKDPDHDLALLRVAEAPTAAFDLGGDEVSDDAPVAAVGYPSEDGRAPAYTDDLIDETYGVERVSPGEVIGANRSAFFHDCTTLDGNSGSPIVARPGAKVVGVHFSGYYLQRNEAVPVSHLRDLLAKHGEG